MQSLAAEDERGVGGQVLTGKLAGDEMWPGGCGNHGSIVRGEGKRGEGNLDAAACGFGGEAAAQLAVGGHAAGNQDAGDTKCLGCCEGFFEQVANYGVLKAGNQVERGGVTGGQGLLECGLWGRVGSGEESFAAGFGLGAQVVQLNVAQHGSLDAGEGEEEVRIELGDGCS